MNKKNAFTLAEMLLVLGILGILMAIAVAVMRPQESARKAAISSALTMLDKAAYNVYTNVKEEDSPYGKKMDSETLCTNLINYINTIESNCNATPIKTKELDKVTFFQEDRNNYVAFKTTTGMDVFISEVFKEDSESENGLFFYLLFVDVNGKKAPNTPVLKVDKNGNPKTYPDIYVFAVIPLGRVIPIGILENDSRLLTAKANQIKTTNAQETIGNSTTYARAKSQAWGFYTSKKSVNGQPVKTDITQQESATGTSTSSSMLEEPYAYNDAIRNIILKKTQKPAFYNNIKLPPSNDDEDFLCADIEDDAFYDGSCSIQIDTYAY